MTPEYKPMISKLAGFLIKLKWKAK